MSDVAVFEIRSDELSRLYKNLKCDGCGKALAPAPVETWAKVGCGYYCAECLARGVRGARAVSCATPNTDLSRG
ncbi:MAG: hypothetical protein ABIK36_12875 [Pseudomonadota bacterium]